MVALAQYLGIVEYRLPFTNSLSETARLPLNAYPYFGSAARLSELDKY